MACAVGDHVGLLRTPRSPSRRRRQVIAQDAVAAPARYRFGHHGELDPANAVASSTGRRTSTTSRSSANRAAASTPSARSGNRTASPLPPAVRRHRRSATRNQQNEPDDSPEPAAASHSARTTHPPVDREPTKEPMPDSRTSSTTPTTARPPRRRPAAGCACRLPPDSDTTNASELPPPQLEDNGVWNCPGRLEVHAYHPRKIWNRASPGPAAQQPLPTAPAASRRARPRHVVVSRTCSHPRAEHSDASTRRRRGRRSAGIHGARASSPPASRLVHVLLADRGARRPVAASGSTVTAATAPPCRPIGDAVPRRTHHAGETQVVVHVVRRKVFVDPQDVAQPPPARRAGEQPTGASGHGSSTYTPTPARRSVGADSPTAPVAPPRPAPAPVPRRPAGADRCSPATPVHGTTPPAPTSPRCVTAPPTTVYVAPAPPPPPPPPACTGSKCP